MGSSASLCPRADTLPLWVRSQRLQRDSDVTVTQLNVIRLMACEQTVTEVQSFSKTPQGTEKETKDKDVDEDGEDDDEDDNDDSGCDDEGEDNDDDIIMMTTTTPTIRKKGTRKT